MKQVSKVMMAIIATMVGISATAQAARAEELGAVIDSISAFGNTMGNSGARPVANQSIGLVLNVKGKLYTQDKKTGAVKEVGDVKQLSIVLPDKVGDRTNAQDLCLRRAEALMSGENQKARLEISMDAVRIGEYHYKVTKLFGCSDLRLASITLPKATPTPRATATPRVTATPTPTPTAKAK